MSKFAPRLPAYLDHFEIHLVDHCNLNCKSCMHFAPCADGKFFLSKEMFAKEMKRIAELVEDKHVGIYLMGGEPLLHPELLELCKIGKETYPCGGFQVVSNGIELLKKDDAWFDEFNKLNISFRLTDYHLNPEIKNVFEKKIIKKWYSNSDKFKHAQLNFNPKYDKEESTSFCDSVPGGMTPCLKEGYLYLCPKMAYKENFEKKFGVKLGEPSETYGINIFDHSKEELLKYLNTPNDFCKYCNSKKVWMIGARVHPRRNGESLDIHEWIEEEN